MPLKLQILSVKAAEWEGWCRHRLEAFRAIREPGRIIKQSYSLPKGVMAQIVCSDICDIIRLWGGAVSGFICHARSDSFPGGITPKGVPISAVHPYPLVDNDHGSFVLTSDGTWTVSRDVENYGNIDWQGSNGTILSWRGPASRHFPLDPSIDYTTPFGPNVYQSGNILATLPNSKILGAAIVNGVLTVACLFNGSYSDEVWQLKNGWQKLWAQDGPSPLGCWFFTAGGTKAYRGNETLEFTSGDPVYTQITDPGGSAKLSIHYNDKYDLKKKGSWNPYREDVLSLSISLKSSENSIVNNQGAETFANVPVYVLSNTGPAPLAIFGPVNFVNPSDYSASGGEGDYTFTFPDPNSCGTQSVSVTDRCGKTGSMDVRMTPGKFVLVSSIPCTTYYTDGGGTNPVTCSGSNSGVRTLDVGTQRVVEAYILTQNPEYINWDEGYCHQCPRDAGGFGCSSAYTPLTLPPLVYTCTLCGPSPFNVTINYYMVVCNVATYNWVCP